MPSPLPYAIAIFLLNTAGRMLWPFYTYWPPLVNAYDVCNGICWVVAFAYFCRTEVSERRHTILIAMTALVVHALFKELLNPSTFESYEALLMVGIGLWIWHKYRVLTGIG